jgi:hypothetical protein
MVSLLLHHLKHPLNLSLRLHASSSLLASQSDFASPLAGIASTGFSTMEGEGNATDSGDLGRDLGQKIHFSRLDLSSCGFHKQAP